MHADPRGTRSHHDAAADPDVRPGVLAVRHGLTEWNETNRWQGWADIALSEAGRRQAAAAAAALAHLLRCCERPVRVVASDLRRAGETAAALAGALGVSVGHAIPDLRERDVGAWSGLTTEEVEAGWPGWLDRWRRGELVSTPSGESEDGLRMRVMSALHRLCVEAEEERSVIVAVTHGGVLRTIDRACGIEPHAVGNLTGRWFSSLDGNVLPGTVVDLLGAHRRDEGTSL